MTDREKKTYKLKPGTVNFIEWLSDHTTLNRQEAVDWMVQHYAKQLKDGSLNDPRVMNELRDDVLDEFNEKAEKKTRKGIKERLGLE